MRVLTHRLIVGIKLEQTCKTLTLLHGPQYAKEDGNSFSYRPALPFDIPALEDHFSVVELPWWLSWQRIHLQCGRPGFDLWVRKIPWRREPNPVFWPREFHGLYGPWGCKESDMTEPLLLTFCGFKHLKMLLPKVLIKYSFNMLLHMICQH